MEHDNMQTYNVTFIGFHVVYIFIDQLLRRRVTDHESFG
jgi:hypothetical protein